MYKISTNYSQNDHMTIIHTPRIEQELHVLAEQTRHLLHKVLLALSQTCKYVPLPGQEMLPLPTRAICAAVLCCLNVMIHHLCLGGEEVLTGGEKSNTYMLSWMNFLILLLVYLSSLYLTELSSNLLLSLAGRNRTTPL